MKNPLHRWLQAACLLLCAAAAPAQALTMEQALAMASGDAQSRTAAINEAAASADERAAALIQALADDAVRHTDTQVFVMDGEQGRDPVTGAAVAVPDAAEDVVNNNVMRRALEAAQSALRLASPDASARAAAADVLLKDPDPSRLPLVEAALAREQDAGVKARLELVRAASALASDDPAQRLAAARALGEQRTPATKLLLNDRLAEEPDAAVQAAIREAIRHIDDTLVWGDRLNAVFSGVSLGSVLLLAALGLAITYGLMGVINMAHGELIMIGAYATYVMQGLFQRFVPEPLFGWYLVAAIPASFLASALVGAVLERGVIRFLYGRPLETPNSREALNLRALVLAAMGWLIARTRLGLFVRGVTQNRPIASCMGVNTARVDTYAFALGSGIAGLAGCALSQIGNVGPDLGQGYIVDSFMVVVMGGVGQLAGTVYAALGLGVLNKFIEGWAGAVLAKIAVLVFIIIFIQKRPQGIFAMKGRSTEA